MSPSEVRANVRRARASGLLHGPDFENRPNISALEEFLTHGLKYVFPAERGELTRGVATSYGAAPLRALIAPSGDPIPVWPHKDGKGFSLKLASYPADGQTIQLRVIKEKDEKGGVQ